MNAVIDLSTVRINELHALAQSSAESAVDYAMQCGEALIAKKETLKHGEWKAWVADNFEASYETAHKYMQVSKMQHAALLEEGKKPESIRQALRQLSQPDKKDVVQFSGDYEWYTPPDILERAREALGVIHLDPASCEQANEAVKAEKYYTLIDNGLKHAWAGNVWLNPPYCQPEIDHFVTKLIDEVSNGHVPAAVLLTNNSSDTAWWQRAAVAASVFCMTAGRISFINGEESSSPLRGQTLFYFGDNDTAFCEAFTQTGEFFMPRGNPS